MITPVYNGEAFIRRCMESVLAQTYRNWDYTIVDNRSTDRTLEIAREFALRDLRIRVVTNEHFVPVNQNYNNGFRRISPESKYCKVIAADDWLFAECLEKMVSFAEEHPSVAIVGAYALADSRVMWQGLPLASSFVTGRDLCRAWLLGGPYVFGTASSELFRSDIVRSRHAFYNESNLHADSEACLEFLRDADFGFVHQVLVFHGTQQNSLTSFSQRMNTYLPYWLYELVEYGPDYLDSNELAARIREVLASYYSYLGEQAYERRERAFWDYHRDKLAEVGYPLNTVRLAAAATSYSLNKLNATSLVRALARPLRKLFTRS
ncbi:MAG TPA: glycosyltransferase family 2 protein [Gemmatimonadaceae bacterium]|nr:glycosyltransferase family 2 protein [Gemmatimonadaceae bacterium]